jgi:hypothetical protein
MFLQRCYLFLFFLLAARSRGHLVCLVRIYAYALLFEWWSSYDFLAPSINIIILFFFFCSITVADAGRGTRGAKTIEKLICMKI